jgi:hypothetical protein
MWVRTIILMHNLRRLLRFLLHRYNYPISFHRFLLVVDAFWWQIFGLFCGLDLRFIICAELVAGSLEALEACHLEAFCCVLLCERALVFPAATTKTHENWLHSAVPSLGTVGEFG